MRRSIAALALAVVLPTGALVAPAARADVVVKPGETLSEIAERNGVSLQRLMQANGIRNPDVVVAGTRLVLPGAPRSSQSGSSGGGGTVTVREGETLSEIANRYGTSVERLMQLNGIRNADMVAAGTRLTLPSRPRAAVASTIKANPKARQHVVQSGETLSHIADAYGIPVERLVSLNKITDPNLVVAGTNLTLQAPPPPKPRPKPVTVARKPKPAAPTVASKPKPAAKPATPVAVQPKPATPVAVQPKPATPVAVQPKPAAPVASTPAVTTTTTATTSTAAAPVATKPAVAPATTATASPVTAATSTAAAPATANAPVTASAVTTSSGAATSVSKVAAATTSITIAKATRSTGSVSPATTTTAATTATATATATRKGAAVQVSRTPSGGPDWRSYGPMQVDWANWRPMGGSFVAPSLGRDGKPHYLAINCGARKLNATSQSGQWRTWDSPQNDEEQRLVSDLCSSKGG